MSSLSGRVALVTGAARGIGAAAALALAARGARILAAVRDPSNAGELEAALATAGGDSLIRACDVADWSQVQAAVDAAISHFGRLDIVVNNAGQIEPIGHLAKTDPAEWARSIVVNLTGSYYTTRAALGPMLSAGRGVIVNVSSGAAHNPREGWSAYCSSKAGLAMLTRTIACDHAAEGIRAYGFQPGVVDTAMQSKIRASGINEISRLSRSQLANPAVPGAVIAWLCTDDAADLAGQELTIADAALRARAGAADPPPVSLPSQATRPSQSGVR